MLKKKARRVLCAGLFYSLNNRFQSFGTARSGFYATATHAVFHNFVSKPVTRRKSTRSNCKKKINKKIIYEWELIGNNRLF
jgi:hypothetical protein